MAGAMELRTSEGVMLTCMVSWRLFLGAWLIYGASRRLFLIPMSHVMSAWFLVRGVACVRDLHEHNKFLLGFFIVSFSFSLIVQVRTL